MFCHNCGAELREGSRFCNKCGTPVQEIETEVEVSEPKQEDYEGTIILDDTPSDIGPDAEPQEVVRPDRPTNTWSTIPDVKKVPEYKDAKPKSKGLKVLAFVAVISVIVAMLAVLGLLFYPQIKEKVEDAQYSGLYKKAQTAVDNGDYEEAVGYYRKLIELNPEESDPYIGLANAYREMGKDDEAVDVLVEGYKATGYSGEGTVGDYLILQLLEDYLEEDEKTLADVDITISDENKEKSAREAKTEGDDGDADAGDEDQTGDAKPYTGKKTDVDINIRQVDNSDFPNMTVYVSVTDKDGKTVENLSKSDFNITEIDKNGNVSDATLDDVYKVLGEDKINVNLILDSSGSMDGSKMNQAKNAANSLLDYMSLGTGDKVEIISFDDYVYLQQDFTSNKDALATAVNGISVGNMTALYDALYAGIYQTYYETGAKCVIAFTDGEENFSSYTFDDVVEIARNTGIPVYIIGIGDTYFKSTLSDLAAQCSGRYYSANDSDLQSILEDIYISIYEEQQDYYVFKYTASNLNDKDLFRDLVIDTSDTTEYNGHYVKSYVPESDLTGAFSKEYMNKDYILDFTSSREVTDADLAGLSLAEMRIARNEIYARHGRQFKDPKLNQWFYSKDWYLSLSPKYSPDYFDSHNPNRLNDIELKNANYILNYEKSVMANEDIYPKAATQLLSEYDLALSKTVLKTALSQMRGYSSTATLEENIRLVQEAIDRPDVTY